MPKNSPEDVKEYYNRMTASYLDIYGDVIQAFRPTDTEKLLDHIARSAGINWNMKVLDLGCGVAGPATYFSKKWNVSIDAVTVSDVQAQIAAEKISQENLDEKVRVHTGDYHQLEQLPIADDCYDVVLFLESLGHSYDIRLAIQQAVQKLKTGGILYIKDFYKKKGENSGEQQKIDKVIRNINRHYAYNTLDLEALKDAVLKAGLKPVFVQPFDFMDDISVRYYFEQANNIDIFEGLQEFYPAEWLEIKCIKPKLPPSVI